MTRRKRFFEIVGALAAFTAAVGGGYLAMDSGVAQPGSFPVFFGLVWLAVVVTLGVRSITAAAIAGLSFSLMPGLFQTYVPARWSEVPTILFGLGAISVARHPEGVVAQNAQKLRALLTRVAPRLRTHHVPTDPGAAGDAGGSDTEAQPAVAAPRDVEGKVAP